MIHAPLATLSVAALSPSVTPTGLPAIPPAVTL